jgi:hypothetical protein
MDDKNKESLEPFDTTGQVIKLIKDTWKDVNHWLASDPADHWAIRTTKFAGKIMVTILFILLSPVIAITLFIAFLVAL